MIAHPPPLPITEPAMLVDFLAAYTLHPTMPAPESVDGDDAVFFGNFYDMSAVFHVRVAVDSPECATLRAAIARNVASDRYSEAKADAERLKAIRVADEARVNRWLLERTLARNLAPI